MYNTKTVYFDTPYNPRMSVSTGSLFVAIFYANSVRQVKHPNLNGKVHLGWAGENEKKDSIPRHLYGEGDLKTRAWCKALLSDWGLKRVLVLSTDLDNIVSSVILATVRIRPMTNQHTTGHILSPRVQRCVHDGQLSIH